MEFKSIVPSEMTKEEVVSMCGILYTKRSWGLPTATVKLANGLDYIVNVERLTDYQNVKLNDI